jgi:hypothetical protein
MTETATKALQDARHELDSLGGLWVTDATEENPHDETWQIDTTTAVNKIEQALARCERSLSERIEAAYDEAKAYRGRMFLERGEIEEREENAKIKHSQEWASAKNNDVRRVLLQEWLDGDAEYLHASQQYHIARNAYRLALLEIDRLKLLVELAKAGDR